MKLKLLFAIVATMLFGVSGAQVTVFSENMGASTSTTTSSISTNVFQNSGTLTYTGDADVRHNTFSTVDLPAASGGRNVFFTNIEGKDFIISGINTLSYTALTLQFAHHKSTTAGSNELVVEVSADGTNYTSLSYNRPTGSGTAKWIMVYPSGTIPSTANLRIRFRQTSTSPQFRIDDVVLTGTVAGFVTDEDGSWNVAGTWAGNVVPGPGDNATVAHNVTSTTAITRNAGTTTTINSGATLTMTNAYVNNGTTTVNGSFQTGTALGGISINPGSTFLVNGSLQINPNGFVQTGAPVYGSSSTLIYNPGGTYGRGFEWSHTGIGTIGVTPGYPNHVILQNTTTFNYNNGTPLAKAINGNLTIQNGSQFYMDYGLATSGGPLTVGGNLVINGGILKLGFASGDDLHIGGDMTVNNPGVFNGNNRAVFFTKPSGTQLITAAAGVTIPYIVFSSTGSRMVRLGISSNLTVSAPLGGNAIAFGSASDVIEINTNTLTIGTAGVANAISGSGTFKGSTTSNLSLYGTGSIGTVNFFSGSQVLGTLTVDRQAAQTAMTLGTPVTINTTLNLTNGLIDLDSNNLTLGALSTVNNAGANSYVIASVTEGGFLRKNLNAAGTYVFPVGDDPSSPNGAQYSPATVTFPAGTFSAGAAYGVSVEDDAHPEMTPSSNYITRYWATNKSGTLSGTYTFSAQYFPTDVVGSESLMVSDYFNGTNWTNQGGAITPGANTLTAVTVDPTLTVSANQFSAGLRPADMHIKGGGTFTQNILSGDMTPTSLDGTLFATQNIGVSQTKTYRIWNYGNEALNVASITLAGDNPGDFSIAATTPYNIAVGAYQDFTVTFTPTMGGVRTAIVTLASNDPDENPYTFMVQGTGNCPTINISATPLSGPEATVVTISSATNLTGATASFNGIAAVVTPVSATQIKVEVPAGATSGPLVVTNAQGCEASVSFVIIDNLSAGCEGSSALPSDLFISQLTDSGSDGISYIEIFNGTGATVNLGTYSLQFFNNGSATQNGGNVALNAVNLLHNATYTVAVGYNSSNAQCTSTPGGNAELGQQVSGSGGINFKTTSPDNDSMGHDHIRLYKNSAHIDSWGVHTNQSWAVSLNLEGEGANFSRKATAVAPSVTYSNADWDIADWGELCTDLDYSDLNSFDFAAGTPPTVTQQPAYAATCAATSFTVTATEGFAGGNALAYQWYVAAPGSATWAAVGNSGVYTGAATATLNISNVAGLTGYQYYVQVRENGATCYTASNAVMITDAATSTWNGTDWIPAPPTNGTVAVIAGNYNTASNGSFEACSLTVNGGSSLTIAGSTYVSIESNLTVNSSGTLLVLDDGSLVQVLDSGVVTNNGTMQVMRTTSPYNRFDYTYWSSPVAAAAIGATFAGWRTDYAFQFVTANYADLVAPFDGFDDNNNAWVYTPPATVMAKGKGYAIMAPTTGTFPATSTVTFSGAVNNGIVTVPITFSANAALTNDDFNLVGNPYPSALFADAFINANPSMAGSLYFWTHRTGISDSNPGPDANNFITEDYAMYNLSGGTSSGTGSPAPSGYVASGQGFFIDAQSATNVVFNNAMRSRLYNNSQFFRPSGLPESVSERDRLWISLRHGGILQSQQLVGFFENSTNGFDRGYDGIVNPSANSISFYSMMDGDRYRIQGRAPFEVSDVIALGYKTAIAGSFTISIDNIEGILVDAGVPVFIEDLLLGTLHDLKGGAYTFTTQTGTFENRFVLRFADAALSNPHVEIAPSGVVAFAQEGTVFVNAGTLMRQVIVYDLRGRILSNSGVISKDSYRVDIQVARQPLIVNVLLESGETISKKILY